MRNGTSYSNQSGFGVTPPTLTPSISSVSPSSVVGSNSPQTFTIHGSNFTAQSIVQVGFRDNNYSQTANPITPIFDSSTQLRFSVTTGTDADNWKVWVRNGTSYSNQSGFGVTPPTLTPSISSVSPSSVVGSNSPQTFTIHGSNFTAQSIVQVGFRDNNYSQTANPITPIFDSSTQLRFSVTTGTDADNWKVWVRNGTSYSNQSGFGVTPPTLTPSISSVSPSSVVGSNSPQTFTIHGSNFTAQSIVQVGFRDNNYSQTANPITPIFDSSTQLRFSVTTGTDADNWKVWVRNGTSYSNQSGFGVTPPTLTPSISSVSPSSVVGSNSPQTFTIHGSNFTAQSIVQVGFRDNNYSSTANPITPIFDSSTQLRFSVTTGTDADNWKVWVRNGSNYSHQGSFSVTVPIAAPTITSVSPNPVTGSNGQITFTVTGSHFVNGTKVQVGYTGNNYVWKDTTTNATYVNATTLTVPITTTTQADTWHVRVKNPDGQTSSTYVNLVVHAPTSGTPTLSVTPSSRSVGAGAGSTAFTVANTGGGTFTWSAAITSGASWLSFSGNAYGTNNGTITALYTADTGNTQRSATIQVTASPGTTGSPATVTVIQGTVSTSDEEDFASYADYLSGRYKVPAVIIKAIMEQESAWNPAAHSPDGGIGLMQVTPPIPNLGTIDPSRSHGDNPFTVVTDSSSVDIPRLSSDWGYNMQIGVQILLGKVLNSQSDYLDLRILENWYLSPSLL